MMKKKKKRTGNIARHALWARLHMIRTNDDKLRSKDEEETH